MKKVWRTAKSRADYLAREDVLTERERRQAVAATKKVILKSTAAIRKLWKQAGLRNGSYGLFKVRMDGGRVVITCERGGTTGMSGPRLALGDEGRKAGDFVHTLPPPPNSRRYDVNRWRKR